MVSEVAPAPSEDQTPAAPETEDALPALRSGPPIPGPITIVFSVVLFLSIVAVFFGVFAYGLSGLQEQRSQHQLYAVFRGLLDPSSPIAPSVGGAIPAGTPVALIDAPRAGLHDVVVVEGTSPADLLAGPGHLRSSPLPGQSGESILLGRSSTAGAPFRQITQLRRGDVVTVRTGQGKFRYMVKGHLAPGSRPPTIRSDDSLLVLGTSAGAGTLDGLTASHLVYVDAELQGKALPLQPHQPRSVSSDELPGHSDPGAWPLAAVWLLVLLLASAATWWLWARWGLLRTWLIGAPVLLGILWALANEGMRLLPNVY
jgi:sortase A